jgi:3,4-dihydroxy 2-butanone 4-phosphate synthase/GTP cyclohydrolase II
MNSDMPADPGTAIDRPDPIRSLEDLRAGLAGGARFRETHGRPFVVLSYAQSVDGSIAGRNRERIRLSGPESMALTHGIRALCDGILIGIGTLLADDPRLTVTHVCGPHPQPVVLDTRLRTPPTARLVLRPDTRPWIIHTPGPPESRAQALRAAGAEPVPCSAGRDGRIDLPAAMALLADRQINRLMVEGGARVITSFVRERIADLLIITISPRFVGGLSVLDAAAAEDALHLQFEETHYQTMGRDLIVWARPGWASP